MKPISMVQMMLIAVLPSDFGFRLRTRASWVECNLRAKAPSVHGAANDSCRDAATLSAGGLNLRRTARAQRRTISDSAMPEGARSGKIRRHGKGRQETGTH